MGHKRSEDCPIPDAARRRANLSPKEARRLLSAALQTIEGKSDAARGVSLLRKSRQGELVRGLRLVLQRVFPGEFNTPEMEDLLYLAVKQVLVVHQQQMWQDLVQHGAVDLGWIGKLGWEIRDTQQLLRGREVSLRAELTLQPELERLRIGNQTHISLELLRAALKHNREQGVALFAEWERRVKNANTRVAQMKEIRANRKKGEK